MGSFAQSFINYKKTYRNEGIMWTMLLSLAGQAASGIMSAINNRRTESAEQAEAARQRAYYESRANENPMERSENAAALGTLDRKLKSMNETSAAKQKIVGGTPEMAVAQQKANANAYADAVSGIAAKASVQRDTALNGLEARRQTDAVNRIKRMDARNQTYANLAANAANAFANLGGLGNGSGLAEGNETGWNAEQTQSTLNSLKVPTPEEAIDIMKRNQRK